MMTMLVVAWPGWVGLEMEKLDNGDQENSRVRVFRMQASGVRVCVVGEKGWESELAGLTL